MLFPNTKKTILALITILCWSTKLIPSDQLPPSKHTNALAPQGGHLHLSHIGHPTTPHPHPTIESPYPQILHLVYETLIEPTWSPHTYTPLLAKDLTFHNSSVDITLHPHATFSDTSPVLSHNVEHALSLLQQSNTHPKMQTMCQQIHITIHTPHHFTLHHPFDHTELLWLLSHLPVIPQHIKNLQDPPIGSGPYTTTLPHHATLTYEKNPQYWGGSLPLKKGRYNVQYITYHFLPSTFAAHLAFQKNHIHFYIENNALRWEKNHQLFPHLYKKLDHPHQSYTQIMWLNPHIRPLNDQTVRHAISLCLPLDFLNQWLYQKHYQPSQLSDSPSSLRNALIQASDQLTQNGWVLHNDHFRYKNGQKLQFTIISPHQNWYPLFLQLQNNGRRIGMDITIEQVPHTTYHEMLKTGYYQLAIEALCFDQGQAPPYNPMLLKQYQFIPKIDILLSALHTSPLFLSEQIFYGVYDDLIQNHMIIPLWSTNTFRIAHHPSLHYIHTDQSFIDIFSWWFEKK